HILGQNVTRGCSGLSVISTQDQPFFNLGMSSFCGKSGDFVSININEEEKKTLTVKDVLNVEFNDEFVLDFDPDNVEDKIILFELWDSDNITKNDFLGQVKTRVQNYFIYFNILKFTFDFDPTSTDTRKILLKLLDHVTFSDDDQI
ncbi:MAG: hypothetical protein EZS28_044312, partial [Streblomastix strix]